jgi:hypothetical protein
MSSRSSKKVKGGNVKGGGKGGKGGKGGGKGGKGGGMGGGKGGGMGGGKGGSKGCSKGGSKGGGEGGSKGGGKGVEALYQHSDGTTERVYVLREHGVGEGEGYTIFMPSLQRERSTVSERLLPVGGGAGAAAQEQLPGAPPPASVSPPAGAPSSEGAAQAHFHNCGNCNKRFAPKDVKSFEQHESACSGGMPKRVFAEKRRHESLSRNNGVYADKFVYEKEDVNMRLPELHGPPTEKHGHAMYLDGPEMRTTTALLEQGWPPERLHVPNNCASDYAAMQAKETGVKLYPCSSSDLLDHLPMEDWVQALKREDRSPLSLVYLDYTDVLSRQNDLKLLLGGGLMTSGVLGITCPARAKHVHESKDRHLRAERTKQPLAGGQHQRSCCVPDHRDDIVGELAGLAKVHVEVKQACTNWSRQVGLPDVTAEPVEVLTYTGKMTRMWVATFAVMADLTVTDPDWTGPYGDPHTIGCSGERNALALQEQHPLLSSMVWEQFSSLRSMVFSSMHWEQFNPAANNGMRDGVSRTTDVLRRIADEKVELARWAFVLKLDWYEREQQREWDFLVAVYGEQQADIIGTIHPMDLAAFAQFIRCYDMWDCTLTGSMQAVDRAMQHGDDSDVASNIELVMVQAGVSRAMAVEIIEVSLGRGLQAGEVETPAMAAEARRETRRGAESEEEGDGGDGAQDSELVW